MAVPADFGILTFVPLLRAMTGAVRVKVVAEDPLVLKGLAPVRLIVFPAVTFIDDVLAVIVPATVKLALLLGVPAVKVPVAEPLLLTVMPVVVAGTALM